MTEWRTVPGRAVGPPPLRAGGDRATPSAPGGEPASRWREHWADHRQVVKLTVATATSAVYVDPDVAPGAGRQLHPYLEDLWRYTNQTYGSFGADPRLYAVLHGRQHRDSHRATYFDPSHDHRNVADLGVGSAGAGGVLDLVDVQVGHIVEAANSGVAGPPALGIWGPDRWTDIFRFDLHVALGDGPRAARLADHLWAATDNLPRPGTYWFRDWFHPLWTDAGGARVLVRFFDVVARSLPRTAEGSYRRMLTWGEFLHFSSAAAQGDVTDLARRAFGWRPGWDAQLDRARAEFPRPTW